MNYTPETLEILDARSGKKKYNYKKKQVDGEEEVVEEVPKDKIDRVAQLLESRRLDAEMPKEEKRRIREEKREMKAKINGPIKRRQTGGFGTSVWQNQPRKLTDKTKCAGTTWAEIKAEAMQPDYKESETWKKMDDTNKDIISHLIIT